jgi:acetyl esterase/lipase
MYKNNSRDSNKFKGCSPLQFLCNLTGKCHAVGYYSYTKRCATCKKYPAINETYKMKIKILAIGLIMIFTLQSFSQIDTSNKKVFVYKTVQGHDIKANIFLPKTTELHPVVVFFHGGFFFGNRDQGLINSLKDKLIETGYAVVSADYRLAPETKLKGILEDVCDINIWLRKNGMQKFNIDTNKIAVAGCSAGGYMALTTGFNRQSAPNAIIAISPPTGFSTSVTPMGDLSVLDQPGPYDIVTDSVISYGDYDSRMTLWRFLAKNGLALYELFGFDPSAEPNKLDKFTLSNNIKSDYPPTLLIHAKNDHLVDVQQVNDFYKFLIEKQINTELFLVENGHSNELINQNPKAIDQIVTFLNMQFK